LADGIVDDVAIIRTIRSQRRHIHISIDLIQQIRYRGHIADVIRCQLDRDDLMRDGINARCSLRHRRRARMPCFWSSHSLSP
jgi:hypothetical protein